MDELDGDVAGVRARRRGAAEGHQASPAGKALGHQVTETGQALGLGVEEPGVGLGPCAQQRRHASGGVGGELGGGIHPAAMASWRVAIRVSQSRQAPMPSPVVALTTMRSTSG